MKNLLLNKFFVLFLFTLGTMEAATNMANPIRNDVCDLSRIYNDDYKYSLPQKILESFLSGKDFDNPQAYTSEESERLHSDINEIYQKIIAKQPVMGKVAVITAGAPGTGKTFKIKQELAFYASTGKNYAYICPDDVCLASQTKTYLADANGNKSQNPYNKWRPGSNAATHLILGNLIRDNCAFYYGMTSSSPKTGVFFEFLKARGYSIRLIHVTAPDDVRWASIQERNDTFVQTTEQDIKEKGLLIPQRINDTYLKYADEIEFYYRGKVKEDAVLAARWLRGKDASEFAGTLEIVEPQRYEQIKSVHNESVRVLKKEELFWERAVEAKSKISIMNG